MSISVITPMFNESLNIEKCYRNLCHQKNINFEWVVIDDGSTDQSVNILRKIISSHNNKSFNIKLIQQNNAGAAAARQNGIKHCTHDIITILDADDQLSDDALELAFSKISDIVDIVCYQVKFVDSNGNFISNFNYTKEIWPVDGDQAFASCIDGWGLSGWFMIKKSVILESYDYINKINLNNTINLDEFISRLNMYNSKKIDICSGIYFYYQNNNSTTRSINKNYYKVIYTALELNKFTCEQCDYSLQVKSQKHLLSTIWGVFSRYRTWRVDLTNHNDWLSAMKTISNTVNYKAILREKMTFTYRIKIYLKICLALYLKSNFLKVNP